jgi:hypothetical protein
MDVSIVDNDLFVQATQKEKQNVPGTFRLKGEIGKFMQDLQRYRLAIALTVDPHAVKSEFVKQLVNAFIDEGLTCGFFDLEQGGLYSKDTRASIDRNITKTNQKKNSMSTEKLLMDYKQSNNLPIVLMWLWLTVGKN